MTSKLSFGLFPFLLVISTVLCDISIPKEPLGYVFNGGRARAPLNLEIYADLTCPHCQHAWPIVKQVAEFYGPEKVRLVFQTFPLPFHTNAFVAAKSVAVVEGYNTSLVFPWIDVLFQDQKQLYDWKTLDKNRFDIYNLIASLATKVNVSESVMKEELSKVKSRYEGQARLSWKHGCTKTVVGTPTFFINDVLVKDAIWLWPFDQWKELIDHLLKK